MNVSYGGLTVKLLNSFPDYSGMFKPASMSVNRSCVSLIS